MAAKIRVLVVDDSVVFRTQIRLALERSDRIEVVGAANNGKIALQKMAQVSVDVVTLDMEMPEMDGLETIQAIKKAGFKARIIVFSSQTKRGSEAALKALALGADDFLAKPDSSQATTEAPELKIAQELIPKVTQFVSLDSLVSQPVSSIPQKAATPVAPVRKRLDDFMPGIIVIGSSTGGPQALEKVLTNLEGPTRCPILVTQHMPPVFTESLAKRLGECSGIPAAEGKDKEALLPNRIYVAPGNFHMKLMKIGDTIRIILDQGPQRNSVRPAVDELFETAASLFKSNCFGMILTGMGEDGMLGCRAIKANSGCIAIQEKESCVVFGMPGAVFSDGCYDEIRSPEKLNQLIRKMAAPRGGLT